MSASYKTPAVDDATALSLTAKVTRQYNQYKDCPAKSEKIKVINRGQACNDTNFDCRK